MKSSSGILKELKTRLFGERFLLPTVIVVSIFLCTLLSVWAFFGLSSVEARFIYVALFFAGFLLPLIMREEKYVPWAYVLMAIPLIILYFFSSQMLVFQYNALPVTRFDTYLELYKSTNTLAMPDVHGLYFAYHLIAYLIFGVCNWSYSATIICFFSFNAFLLFLLSALYFRALRRISSFSLAYVFSTSLILFSFSFISVLIFDDKYYGFILFMFFIYFVALGRSSHNFDKKIQTILLLLAVAISFSSLMASISLIAFTLVLSAMKKSWKVAVFSLPALIYTLYGSFSYLLIYVQYSFDVAREYLKILQGEANIGQAGLQPGAVPVYDTIGNYVFTLSYYAVLGGIWFYLFFLFSQKKKRAQVKPEIKAASLLYLMILPLAAVIIVATRVSPNLGDMGSIFLIFAEIVLPISIIPIVTFAQKILQKSNNNATLKALMISLLIIIVVSSPMYVYTLSYPKSVHDPILNVQDWDIRHEPAIYATYLFINAQGGSLINTVVMTPESFLIYGETLELKGINAYYYNYEGFSAAVGSLQNNPTQQTALVCYPNYLSFEEIGNTSNIIYDNGAQAIEQIP